MKLQKIIVTNVNYAYIPLLENLRRSLKKVGLLKFLCVFAVGKNCKKKLDRLGIENILINDESAGDQAIRWSWGNWKKMTYQKVKAVNLALDKFGSFLYTDPDVVFQKEVFSFLASLPEGFDIYGQDDYPHDRICSGFMYIKNNAATKKLFSIGWEEYDSLTSIGDQVYINKKRDWLCMYSLPKDLFLNGIWFVPSRVDFTPSKELIDNAYIAHYNFAYSIQSKFERMKINNHLYVKLWRNPFLPAIKYLSKAVFKYTKNK